MIDKILTRIIGGGLVAIVAICAWMVFAEVTDAQGVVSHSAYRSNLIIAENSNGRVLFVRVLTPIYEPDQPMDAQVRQRIAISNTLNRLAKAGWAGRLVK